jgi:hypothetical protein
MDKIYLKELGEGDLEAVQTLFENCEDYFVLTTGGSVTSASAHSLYIQIPEGKSYDDKHILGVYEDSKLIGVIDAILDYPEKDIVTLGLFLIDLRHQIVGMENAYKLLERWCIDQKASKIRISVYEILEGEIKFWQEMGFLSTGQNIQDGDRAILIMEKSFE